ncbi:unnamed protein product [Rotaria socialis]|uniref:Uncharacterized protein n=1 Tax=Rotaria socialis TaxID=392032 RepID=A0A818IF67_9BILA|nr:unnamed protein product [Rotaria socialis]
MGNMNCKSNSCSSKDFKTNSPSNNRPISPAHIHRCKDHNHYSLTLPHLKSKGNTFKIFYSYSPSPVRKMARNCLPNNPLKEPKNLLPRWNISSSMNNLSNRTKLACRTCSSSSSSSSSSFKLEKRQFAYSRYGMC